jgi:hypothetical protein
VASISAADNAEGRWINELHANIERGAAVDIWRAAVQFYFILSLKTWKPKRIPLVGGQLARSHYDHHSTILKCDLILLNSLTLLPLLNLAASASGGGVAVAERERGGEEGRMTRQDLQRRLGMKELEKDR